MAEKILSADQVAQLENDISEACSLVHNSIELIPAEDLTASTLAAMELARKVGWLLDRCSQVLGSPGVRGHEWTSWCGGYAQRVSEAQEDARHG